MYNQNIMRLAYPGTKPIVTAWLTDFGSLISMHMYALPRVTLSLVVANKKGTDQPALPRSLISAFVNRSLENTISRCAISEKLIFQHLDVL